MWEGGRTLTNQDGGGGGEGRGGWEVTVVGKAAGVGRQQQSLEGAEQDCEAAAGGSAIASRSAALNTPPCPPAGGGCPA